MTDTKILKALSVFFAISALLALLATLFVSETFSLAFFPLTFVAVLSDSFACDLEFRDFRAENRSNKQ